MHQQESQETRITADEDPSTADAAAQQIRLGDDDLGYTSQEYDGVSLDPDDGHAIETRFSEELEATDLPESIYSAPPCMMTATPTGSSLRRRRQVTARHLAKRASVLEFLLPAKKRTRVFRFITLALFFVFVTYIINVVVVSVGLYMASYSGFYPELIDLSGLAHPVRMNAAGSMKLLQAQDVHAEETVDTWDEPYSESRVRIPFVVRGIILSPSFLAITFPYLRVRAYLPAWSDERPVFSQEFTNWTLAGWQGDTPLEITSFIDLDKKYSLSKLLITEKGRPDTGKVRIRFVIDFAFDLGVFWIPKKYSGSFVPNDFMVATPLASLIAGNVNDLMLTPFSSHSLKISEPDPKTLLVNLKAIYPSDWKFLKISLPAFDFRFISTLGDDLGVDDNDARPGPGASSAQPERPLYLMNLRISSISLNPGDEAVPLKFEFKFSKDSFAAMSQIFQAEKSKIIISLDPSEAFYEHFLKEWIHENNGISVDLPLPRPDDIVQASGTHRLFITDKDLYPSLINNSDVSLNSEKSYSAENLPIFQVKWDSFQQTSSDGFSLKIHFFIKKDIFSQCFPIRHFVIKAPLPSFRFDIADAEDDRVIGRFGLLALKDSLVEYIGFSCELEFIYYDDLLYLCSSVLPSKSSYLQIDRSFKRPMNKLVIKGSQKFNVLSHLLSVASFEFDVLTKRFSFLLFDNCLSLPEIVLPAFHTDGAEYTPKQIFLGLYSSLSSFQLDTVISFPPKPVSQASQLKVLDLVHQWKHRVIQVQWPRITLLLNSPDIFPHLELQETIFGNSIMLSLAEIADGVFLESIKECTFKALLKVRLISDNEDEVDQELEDEALKKFSQFLQDSIQKNIKGKVTMRVLFGKTNELELPVLVTIPRSNVSAEMQSETDMSASYLDHVRFALDNFVFFGDGFLATHLDFVTRTLSVPGMFGRWEIKASVPELSLHLTALASEFAAVDAVAHPSDSHILSLTSVPFDLSLSLVNEEVHPLHVVSGYTSWYPGISVLFANLQYSTLIKCLKSPSLIRTYIPSSKDSMWALKFSFLNKLISTTVNTFLNIFQRISPLDAVSSIAFKPPPSSPLAINFSMSSGSLNNFDLKASLDLPNDFVNFENLVFPIQVDFSSIALSVSSRSNKFLNAILDPFTVSLSPSSLLFSTSKLSFSLDISIPGIDKTWNTFRLKQLFEQVLGLVLIQDEAALLLLFEDNLCWDLNLNYDASSKEHHYERIMRDSISDFLRFKLGLMEQSPSHKHEHKFYKSLLDDPSRSAFKFTWLICTFQKLYHHFMEVPEMDDQVSQSSIPDAFLAVLRLVKSFRTLNWPCIIPTMCPKISDPASVIPPNFQFEMVLGPLCMYYVSQLSTMLSKALGFNAPLMISLGVTLEDPICMDILVTGVTFFHFTLHPAVLNVESIDLLTGDVADVSNNNAAISFEFLLSSKYDEIADFLRPIFITSDFPRSAPTYHFPAPAVVIPDVHFNRNIASDDSPLFNPTIHPMVVGFHQPSRQEAHESLLSLILTALIPETGSPPADGAGKDFDIVSSTPDMLRIMLFCPLVQPIPFLKIQLADPETRKFSIDITHGGIKVIEIRTSHWELLPGDIPFYLDIFLEIDNDYDPLGTSADDLEKERRKRIAYNFMVRNFLIQTLDLEATLHFGTLLSLRTHHILLAESYSQPDFVKIDGGFPFSLDEFNLGMRHSFISAYPFFMKYFIFDMKLQLLIQPILHDDALRHLLRLEEGETGTEPDEKSVKPDADPPERYRTKIDFLLRKMHPASPCAKLTDKKAQMACVVRPENNKYYFLSLSPGSPAKRSYSSIFLPFEPVSSLLSILPSVYSYYSSGSLETNGNLSACLLIKGSSAAGIQKQKTDVPFVMDVEFEMPFAEDESSDPCGKLFKCTPSASPIELRFLMFDSALKNRVLMNPFATKYLLSPKKWMISQVPMSFGQSFVCKFDLSLNLKDLLEKPSGGSLILTIGNYVTSSLNLGPASSLALRLDLSGKDTKLSLRVHGHPLIYDTVHNKFRIEVIPSDYFSPFSHPGLSSAPPSISLLLNYVAVESRLYVTLTHPLTKVDLRSFFTVNIQSILAPLAKGSISGPSIFESAGPSAAHGYLQFETEELSWHIRNFSFAYPLPSPIHSRLLFSHYDGALTYAPRVYYFQAIDSCKHILKNFLISHDLHFSVTYVPSSMAHVKSADELFVNKIRIPALVDTLDSSYLDNGIVPFKFSAPYPGLYKVTVSMSLRLPDYNKRLLGTYSSLPSLASRPYSSASSFMSSLLGRAISFYDRNYNIDRDPDAMPESPDILHASSAWTSEFYVGSIYIKSSQK